MILLHKLKYTNHFTGLQLCFGQPVDIEMLSLLRSEVNEVAEAVQTWMLKKKQVSKVFNRFIMHVEFLCSLQPLSSAEVSRIPQNSFQFSVVFRGIAEGNLCQKTRPNTQLTGGDRLLIFNTATILHNICTHYTAQPAFNIV